METISSNVGPRQRQPTLCGLAGSACLASLATELYGDKLSHGAAAQNTTGVRLFNP